MEEKQLNQIEKKAGIQFQFFEYKMEYHRLKDNIAKLEIPETDKKILSDGLAERYWQLSEQLINEEASLDRI